MAIVAAACSLIVIALVVARAPFLIATIGRGRLARFEMAPDATALLGVVVGVWWLYRIALSSGGALTLLRRAVITADIIIGAFLVASVLLVAWVSSVWGWASGCRSCSSS